MLELTRLKSITMAHNLQLEELRPLLQAHTHRTLRTRQTRPSAAIVQRIIIMEEMLVLQAEWVPELTKPSMPFPQLILSAH